MSIVGIIKIVKHQTSNWLF